MFNNTFKALVLSFVVATGGLAAATSTANAGKLDIEFSISGPGYRFSTGSGYQRTHYRGYRGYRKYRRNWDYPRHGYRDRPRYEQRYRKRLCSPNRAVQKARRMGVRSPSIARVNRRVIVIKGYRWGDWTKIKFGRGGRCPVIVVRTF